MEPSEGSDTSLIKKITAVTFCYAFLVLVGGKRGRGGVLKTEVSAAEQLLAATRNTARVSFIWLSGHKRFFRPEPARHSLLTPKLWILGEGGGGRGSKNKKSDKDR